MRTIHQHQARIHSACMQIRSIPENHDKDIDYDDHGKLSKKYNILIDQKLIYFTVTKKTCQQK